MFAPETVQKLSEILKQLMEDVRLEKLSPSPRFVFGTHESGSPMAPERWKVPIPKVSNYMPFKPDISCEILASVKRESSVYVLRDF